MDAAMQPLRHPEEPPFQSHCNDDYYNARRQLIHNQMGYWLNLERYQPGFDLLEEVKALDFKVHILTKAPRSSPNAWQEKANWCDKHLPGIDLTITQDKSLMFGDVLIDDFPAYFAPWLERHPAGKIICPAHSWNAQYARGGELGNERVLRYDGTNMAEVRALLEGIAR